MEPRRGRWRVWTLPCIFGEEKNQEALMCFFSFSFFLVFFVFGREEKSSVHPGWKKGARGSLFFLVWSVPRAFYSPGTIYKAATLVGPPPSNGFGLGWSWHPWKDLDFLFLKRYGTWKSSNRIKSYGSQKLAVHRSMRYHGFRDILAVLTPISTHE